jgi:hypothetical protein
MELLSGQMQELSPLVGIVLIEGSLGNRVFYARQLVSELHALAYLASPPFRRHWLLGWGFGESTEEPKVDE